MYVYVYIHTGADPYSLLEQSYDAISRRLGTFRTRVHKQTPAGIDSFGYVYIYHNIVYYIIVCT